LNASSLSSNQLAGTIPGLSQLTILDYLCVEPIAFGVDLNGALQVAGEQSTDRDNSVAESVDKACSPVS